MDLKATRMTLSLVWAALWSAGLAAQPEAGPLEVAVASHESVAVARVFDGTVEAVHQATVSAQPPPMLPPRRCWRIWTAASGIAA